MIVQKMKNTLRLGLFALVFSFSVLCFANVIETQLSTDKIMMGDTVYVTYFSNNSHIDNAPNFVPLQNDFRLIDTNYGTAVNMVNGVTTTQSYWRIQLQPKHTGEIIIPEIQFGSDKSTAQKLTVSASHVTQNIQNSSSSINHEAPVFVRGEVNNTSPYVQSFVLYTFKLYFRSHIIDPQVMLPQLQDATILQLADVPVQQTKINNSIYSVVEKNFAIFPKKTGKLHINPLQFKGMLMDNNSSPYDDPYNYDLPKPVSVATKEVNLIVRDIPENYQGHAWLPAKNITMTEQWSDNTNKRLVTGTPITRTILIKAEGLRADQIPDVVIDNINGVNVYADRPKRDNDISKDIVTGIYEQKVTYIPNKVDSFTTPAIKINWWNTQSNASAVTQLNEQTFQVNTSAAIAAPMRTAQSNSTSVSTASTPYYFTAWFWVACMLLAAWLITLWLLFRGKSASAEPNTQLTSEDMSEKSFKQACKQGEAVQAQNYLLQWAKLHWPEEQLTLTSLRQIIKDENFARELHALEQSLYAKKKGDWSGDSLFIAFQRLKKSTRNNSQQSRRQTEPLPPLNPES